MKSIQTIYISHTRMYILVVFAGLPVVNAEIAESIYEEKIRRLKNYTAWGLGWRIRLRREKLPLVVANEQ